MTAREDRDAAMLRHPSGVRELDWTFTTTDEARFHALFTAEAQRYPHQNLPPNWQAWADENTPDDHPIPDAVALVVVGFLALIVPTLIVVAAWHWLVQ